MREITGLSAVEIVRKASSGELSAADIIEAHIARIEQVNPQINAVVTPLFEQARQEAQAADSQRAQGAPLPPLFGLPVTIKDSLDVAGAAATCGMLARKDRIAEKDAAVVGKLRQAGAIVIGKTNTPEVCWAQETTNLLYGRTNNPWNLERSVGGSTGGEAAIIAAGGSPLGIGSDISGSIRLPAAFTGIVGLRPTSATLDETGHYPYATGRLADLEAIGPMARRVEDVALAFEALTGRAVPETSILSGQKVAYWFGGGLMKPEASIRAAVSAAVGALEKAGMQAVEKPVTGRVRFSAVGWLAYVDRDGRKAIDDAFIAGSVWKEMRSQRGGRQNISAESTQYWMSSTLSSIFEKLFDGARWRERLNSSFLEWVGEGGVVVCPIHPTTAPRHGWQKSASALTLDYQQWVNLAGLPGLTVPTGFDANKLPTAVQIVGARGREDVILAAGMAVQQAVMPTWVGPGI
jgi:Asp-tRNA(Asn)/Glu-tRNA(Gln) amidotransferase A subunit family amidase